MKKKSTQAVMKKIEAGNSRQIAKQYLELNDFASTDFYNLEARRLNSEAEELLMPMHPVIIGTGGEALQPDADNQITDLLLKDPTSLQIDASTDRLQLLEKLDSVAPALDAADSIGAKNSLEKMMAHQMAVAHVTAMNLLAEAADIRRLSTNCNAEILALKKQNTARMFMDLYVRMMEALTKIRSGGRQNITVTHKTVSVSGGNAIIADQVTSGGRMGGTK